MTRRSALLLVLLAACSEAATQAPPMPALSARGADLVDDTGTVVVLRGANLGGWIFHEPWITHADYTQAGRLWATGVQAGLQADLEAALVEVGPGAGPEDPRVCPGGGDAWLATLRDALTRRVGTAKAAEILDAAATRPSVCADSDVPYRALLEDRFGVEGRDELQDAFQSGFVVEDDIAWLAAQGFNLVRVPMSWRDLSTLSDGTDLSTVDRLPWNERTFARIDRLLDWCRAHRVWAILDLQEAPGGQNTYKGIEPRLYADPHMQELTVQFWQELSRRYRDRPEVAAYSLLAEPFGAPSAAERDRVYDLLVKAIRAGGDGKLLVIHDGFFDLRLAGLPDPAAKGWTNVVYSTHFFESTPTSVDQFQAVLDLYDAFFGDAQATQKVPYFIGSFSTRIDQDWAYEALDRLVGWMEGHRWSWAIWTLKRADDPLVVRLWNFRTAWGLLGRIDGDFERPDPWVDDFATLKRRLAGYAAVRYQPNDRILEVLARHAAGAGEQE